MANIDKVSVKNTVYNIVSPAVVSDYIEVIGGACTKPDGYEEDEVILAKQNDVQLLFKATQDIAFGANIVENTNCVRTTLEEVLKNAGGGGGASSADQVSYNNSASGLEAENVQEAVDELASENQTLTNNLANEVVTRAKLGGHNLLPNNAETALNYQNKGIDYVVNDDGSITASGIATSGQTFHIAQSINFKAGSYILTGCPSDSNGDYQIVIQGKGVDDGDGFTLNLASDTVLTIDIYINNAVDITTPITFYPMLRLATDANADYEPYAKTNKELTDELTGTYEDVTYENNGATRHLYLARVGKVVSVYIPETDLVIDSTMMLIKSGFPLPYGTDAKIACPDGNGGFMRLQINSAGSLYILQGESSATRRIFGIITYICK